MTYCVKHEHEYENHDTYTLAWADAVAGLGPQPFWCASVTQYFDIYIGKHQQGSTSTHEYMKVRKNDILGE